MKETVSLWWKNIHEVSSQSNHGNKQQRDGKWTSGRGVSKWWQPWQELQVSDVRSVIWSRRNAPLPLDLSGEGFCKPGRRKEAWTGRPGRCRLGWRKCRLLLSGGGSSYRGAPSTSSPSIGGVEGDGRHRLDLLSLSVPSSSSLVCGFLLERQPPPSAAGQSRRNRKNQNTLMQNDRVNRTKVCTTKYQDHKRKENKWE